jgi:hypothetical protein
MTGIAIQPIRCTLRTPRSCEEMPIDVEISITNIPIGPENKKTSMKRNRITEMVNFS